MVGIASFWRVTVAMLDRLRERLLSHARSVRFDSVNTGPIRLVGLFAGLAVFILIGAPEHLLIWMLAFVAVCILVVLGWAVWNGVYFAKHDPEALRNVVATYRDVDYTSWHGDTTSGVIDGSARRILPRSSEDKR